MPRVHTKTRNRGGKHVYTCSACHKPVEAGESYFTWSRRFGRMGRTYYRHVACGRPRPSELSGRKTAIVEDAMLDAENAIDAWSEELPEFPTDTLDLDTSDLNSALETVADEAVSVGDEYEEGADNMPESLQYGSQAEAMREVADELRQWADELRSWAADDTQVTLPDPAAYEDKPEGSWENDAQGVLDEALDAIREEARSAMEDMPEYQG
jgi:hypothetical protein